ncbi:hypothetical protein YP76_26405 [Sphingobium chungbukense]|uniref:Uncharacterized protein n=1 Tax=Sphingobium chungbukense TaxID=56193 RepID=A0A0M3AGQ9_9SPHN|nr:hypothetical protein YP76_26405 [Sphingobium chungbukense]
MADQQAAGPKTRFGLIIFVGVEIGEFAIGPVMKPCAFGAFARGEALPCIGSRSMGDLLVSVARRPRLRRRWRSAADLAASYMG